MKDEITIKAKTRTYDVKLDYHSELMCENHEAKISASVDSTGRISFTPKRGYVDGFLFCDSDPDRVIAIARMFIAFAEMVKNETKKTIDISEKVVVESSILKDLNIDVIQVGINENARDIEGEKLKHICDALINYIKMFTNYSD